MNIKINFQNGHEVNAISWDNRVNEIIDGIESGKRLTFKVYMKNLMPIKEMDNSVRELCDTINTRFDTFSKYYRNNECIAAGYTEMLASATYYIEIRSKE